MLRPQHERVYERILVYGDEGSGKTRDWMEIAKLAQKTGSDSQFHVIDTDFAVPRMMTGEAFAGLDNVHDVQVGDWNELVEATEKARMLVRPQDWLVIDMISWGWGWVQDEWIVKRYGVSAGQHWGQWVEKGGKGNALEGDTDWNIINRNWREFSGPLMRLQGHLFCTGATKKVSDRDSEDIKKLYGRHGVKPEGQKSLGHLFHTVLLAKNSGRDEWRLTTVKDRERAMLEGDVVKNFAMSYLLKTAGWRP